RFLFRADDFLFELFQIGRDEALRVDERLFADVVGRNFSEVRFRHFDVIAEDGVVANLERGDAGALALARFDLHQNRLRIAGDGAQLVELAIDATPNRAAVADRWRRIRIDR